MFNNWNSRLHRARFGFANAALRPVAGATPMTFRFTIRDMLWLTALVAMGRHLAAAPLCKADRV